MLQNESEKALAEITEEGTFKGVKLDQDPVKIS